MRSSRQHFVKTSALRRVCLALLVPVPWASRVWSLPFLSALAYSERYAQEQGKRHKTLTDWAGQLLLLVRRWYPEREIVAVADGGYAALKLLDCCRSLSEPITFITRLRLDAALYKPAPPRCGQIGRPRLKGDRLPNLSVLAEDPTTDWAPVTLNNWYGNSKRTIEIVSGTALWYSTGLPAVPLRWVLIRDPQGVRDSGFAVHRPRCRAGADHLLVCETLADGDYLQEVRQRLGFETQRQWSERRSGELLQRCWGCSRW